MNATKVINSCRRLWLMGKFINATSISITTTPRTGEMVGIVHHVLQDFLTESWVVVEIAKARPPGYH
jgi:hypothetical protein